MNAKLTVPQQTFLLALAATDLVARKRLMRRVARSYTRLQSVLLAKGLVDIIRTPNVKWLRDDIKLVLTEAGLAAAAEAQS